MKHSSKRSVRCTHCTPFRWKGNAKDRVKWWKDPERTRTPKYSEAKTYDPGYAAFCAKAGDDWNEGSSSVLLTPQQAAKKAARISASSPTPGRQEYAPRSPGTHANYASCLAC
jgi:hypothetical protein